MLSSRAAQTKPTENTMSSSRKVICVVRASVLRHSISGVVRAGGGADEKAVEQLDRSRRRLFIVSN